MNGGNGRNSYANNSSLQRNVIDRSKTMVDEAIIWVALWDQILSLLCKYRKSGSTPEFHVYFNDHTSNDFHTRLFPKGTLHIAHSSYFGILSHGHGQDGKSLFITLSFSFGSGIGEETKVDSFNLPVYLTTPGELKELIEKNGCFSIESTMDILLQENEMRTSAESAQTFSGMLRAGWEGSIKSHFGCDEHIIDHLFQDLYPKKFEDAFVSWSKTMEKNIILSVLLKRKY
ncbi:hypothetical protein MKW94_026600 [Papaver nudicaule]|uniref:Uncharacterized protein n=1 Tax=Papaver nudicaule TaxID=74823 RepID=A0AA41UU82_PAPNU|nr:hypothetical protein [Papaver nudicaule]